MKRIAIVLLSTASFFGCKQTNKNTDNYPEFRAFLDHYYEAQLKLNPLQATMVGDERYNDLLPNDGSVAFLKEWSNFNKTYLDSLEKYDRSSLSENDQLSFDNLQFQLKINLEGDQYHFEYMPFNQFYSLPLTMGQFGTGTGAQPFNTVKNYEDWLKRVAAFSVWADTAIGNFKKGLAAGIILPKSLVTKMIPQLQAMVVSDPKKSLFYGPVQLMPKDFSAADKEKLTKAYENSIMNVIVPTYKKLGDYLQYEYLPKASDHSGFSSMNSGAEMYAFQVKVNTTTNKTPEEIYQTGLAEVARIRKAMDSIKQVVGFKGDLKAFFEFMKTDKRFMPYHEPKEVIAAFEAIHQRMQSNLKKMFLGEPKTPFEIRQTEAFREASASAEYNQGSADGTRPGIFYVPILDASQYNTTSGMESLFLHEAIPGHHYQISLTQENTTLPKYRRYSGYTAYEEGWALYCESLGKELGLYTDPYQYMGALGDEIHRAIRLVVDVAIHTKNMTREEAIKYMMDNEAISEQGAIAEIERYMAIPGQALGYKIGAMKIASLRKKYEAALGAKFSLAEFHHQVLKDGSLPLSVFEAKMDHWAAGIK